MGSIGVGVDINVDVDVGVGLGAAVVSPVKSKLTIRPSNESVYFMMILSQTRNMNQSADEQSRNERRTSKKTVGNKEAQDGG